MKILKLTNRERTVVKAIDNVDGSTGGQLLEATNFHEPDLLDVLNGLTNAGFLEAFAPEKDFAMTLEVSEEQFLATRFEINPAFAQQLHQAVRRS